MGTSSLTVTPGPLDGPAGEEPTLAWSWADVAGLMASVPSGSKHFPHHLSIPGSFCFRKAPVEIPHLQNSLRSPEV